MAEIETLPTPVVQVAQVVPCANCTNVSEISQDLSQKSSFNTHLAQSLQTISKNNNGESLPEAGKILPQSITSITDYDHIDQSQLQQPENHDFEHLEELLPGLEAVVIQKPPDITVSKEEVNDLNILKNDVNDSIQVESELESILPIALPYNQESLSGLQSIPINIVTQSTAGDVVSEAVLQNYKNINNVDLYSETSEDFLSSIQNQSREKLNSTSSTQDSLLESLYEKNGDKYLEFELLNKKQLSDKETGNNILSIQKPNLTLQQLTQSNINDLSIRINPGSTANHTIDTPIPINLKHNTHANFEVVSQTTEQSLHQNIKWLVGNKLQNANINIYPETLGHINVSVNIEDSKLSVHFLVSNSLTKDVIDANIVNLKENLVNDNANIKEVNISSGFSGFENGQSQYLDENDKGYQNYQDTSSTSNNEEQIKPLFIKHNIQSSVYLIDAFV